MFDEGPATEPAAHPQPGSRETRKTTTGTTAAASHRSEEDERENLAAETAAGGTDVHGDPILTSSLSVYNLWPVTQYIIADH
jgi:hypothetical protein